MDAMSAVARKSGLSAQEMRRIFDTFTIDKDSLWVDMTSKSPYKLRKNGFIILKKKD
jgi:hypothetical protein